MKIETKNLLNVATVADKLGVKRQFIWSLIKAEKFKPIVIDRTTFIQLGDVEGYEPRTVGRPRTKSATVLSTRAQGEEENGR